MACLSRAFLAATTALAVAAPAYAADQARGQLNKDLPPTAQAPATSTTPTVAPVEAPATPAAPKAPAKAPTPAPAKTNATTQPVTKGTTKKALSQLAGTTAADSSGATAATRTRHARSVAPRTTTITRSSSTGGGSATGSGRTRGSASRAAATAAAAARHAAVIAAAARHTRSAPRTAVRHTPAQKAGSRAKRAKPAPFTAISRAAARVVEVIPGALVLALAGLAALVLVLILRSWVTERRRGRALASSYGITVQALATAIEAKDMTTGGHIERVRLLGLLLAGQIAPREARDPQMAYGFLLHDIGKLAVPDEILRAPGRLTDEQWTLMRRHPEEGVRMLASVPFLDRALDVVRHHHERWDGGGYPDGLAGEQIPLWARIFSVVDALDAMTA
ncbi:MAG: hypothetical protein QOC55_279, partial [Thermoleophilaceae bacterium]|nr:hypothetical protein [Thermoleophilaceae bacterium]